MFVYSALERRDAAIVEALKHAPAMATLHRLRTQYVSARPQLASFDDHTLGLLLGDAALTTAAATRLRQPSARAAARVQAALTPYSEATQLYLGFIRKLAGS